MVKNWNTYFNANNKSIQKTLRGDEWKSVHQKKDHPCYLLLEGIIKVITIVAINCHRHMAF